MNEPLRGLYATARRKASLLLALLIGLGFLVNLGVALFLTHPSWQDYQTAHHQLGDKRKERDELAGRPIVQQATAEQIAALLTAVPLQQPTSSLTEEITELAAKSGVLFAKLEQGQPAASGTASTGAKGETEASSTVPPSAESSQVASSSAVNREILPAALDSQGYQVTVYGDIDGLQAFLNEWNETEKLYAVPDFKLDRIKHQQEGDIASLLYQLPNWRAGTDAYALSFSLRTYTLSKAYKSLAE
ncbi:hypothetical protein [Gorillibacterium sp. CAU 1737]|uniref:hypothetical protein n=1 Tax=Gorillibacterium sp. CAU 1737 TaxID=3140362 RepID=UPI003261933D